MITKPIVTPTAQPMPLTNPLLKSSKEGIFL